jgi:cell wall-associated NlpC family hydrolase
MSEGSLRAEPAPARAGGARKSHCFTASLVDPCRVAVLAEAASWIGTPYQPAQRVKGAGGGVDCLTFVAEVYERAGVVRRVEIPFYPADWHLHRDVERYVDGVLEYAREVETPQPGDVVLFRFGRCFAHGGIVIHWPRLIHAWNGAGVVPADADQPLLGKRPRRFFSPFGQGTECGRRTTRVNPSSVVYRPSGGS